MKIENEFTVPATIERAWALLTDLEAIAPCLPGAQLTGVDGEVYSGKVKIKVGPVTAEYAGTAQFTEKDDTGYRAVIDARGRDARGAGNASALIVAQLRADGSNTVVKVDTDLKISGKIAQFGSGMIKEVSEKLLGQFANCLQGKLTDVELPAATAAPVAAPEPVVASGPVVAPVPAAATEPVAAAPGVDSTPVVGSAPVFESAPVVEPAPVIGSAPVVAAAVVAPPQVGTARVITPSAEPEALDLMALAGGSVYKRLLPLGAAVVVIIAAIIYFIVK